MMKNIQLMVGCLLIGTSTILPVNAAMASGTATAEQVMQTYLTGLSNGDVVTLSSLIGGIMKERSYRLLTQNEQYPLFLRTRYAGVVMTIEAMTQENSEYVAKVRFNYPSSDFRTNFFTLKIINGQWKIIDEQLF